ncbi:MAG: DNA polymerase IV [Pirellulaceae bacterium]
MIIHVDMDAFYASVEEREQPELRGKPVIVGGTPEGRGVVAAANYVVRQFGVHSAMPTSTALKLCPEAIVLPGRLDYYADISRQLHEVFYRYTPLIEPLALDEAFLDVSGTIGLFDSVEQMGRKIKEDIWQEVELVASVGVAPNKFLAKLASDLQKPDGFVVVDGTKINEFLDPLPVSRIWGVGRVTDKAFEKLGIRTIQQLRELPQDFLEERFGKLGTHVWKLAQGVDDRPVIPDRGAKSISNETTFPADIDQLEVLQSSLMELTEQVARRLRRSELRGRTVHIKVRYHDFETITRSQTLAAATSSTNELWQVALEMLTSRLPDRHLCARLLGMGVSGLESADEQQRTLFDQQEDQRDERLDEVTDQIKDRFGKRSVRRGSAAKMHRSDRPDLPSG